MDDAKKEDGSHPLTDTEDAASAKLGSDLLTGVPLYMLICGISLAGFVYSLDTAIIVTAIPIITTHFHTIEDIGWYGSAYLLTLCACAPMTGKIYQYYNSKVAFFIFVAIFEVGSILCGIAPSSKVLIVGRAVAGIGGSGLLSGGFTIVSQSVHKEQRQHIIAVIYAFSLIGSILAPLIGGALTEKVSWRWCFYINLPIGAVTLAFITFVRIPDKRVHLDKKATLSEQINRLDPIGFLLFAPAVIMLLLALNWGGSSHAWNSSIIIGLLVGSVATLAVLVYWEHWRGATGMIPLPMLRRRVIYTSCVVVMLQFGSLNIQQYYLPLWFQTILGVSPITSGVYFLATATTAVVTILIAGIIAAKLGIPTIFTIVGNAISCIALGLLSSLTPHSHAAAWAGYQVISGLGRGLSLQQPINYVQHSLEPAEIAVGTSLVLFFQFFGGAIFLVFAETDFSNYLRAALKHDAPGVSAELIVAVGASGVSGAVTSQQLPGVLDAYNNAVIHTFYLACAASGFGFLAAWGMGVKSIKSKAPAKSQDVELT